MAVDITEADFQREVVDASDLWREHRERPVPGTADSRDT